MKAGPSRTRTGSAREAAAIGVFLKTAVEFVIISVCNFAEV